MNTWQASVAKIEVEASFQQLSAEATAAQFSGTASAVSVSLEGYVGYVFITTYWLNQFVGMTVWV